MSKIEVDQVDPQSGTTLTLGTSGDTVSIPSGVTLANAGTVTGIPASAISSGTLADARIPDLNASKITAGTIATARLGSGTASSSTFLRGDQTYAEAGGGKIGQVVSTHKTDIFSTTNGINGSGFTDITGLSVSITPSATSSKILILGSIMCSDTAPNRVYFRLVRGSTVIGNASTFNTGTPCIASSFQAASTTFTDSVGINFLDSPNSTSAQTYKFTVTHNQGNGNSTTRINGQNNSGGGASDDNTTSTITVMEILA